MNPLLSNFLVNVAAGVFLAILGQFLFRVAAPYYRAWLYKAPQLAGNWSLFDGDPAGKEPVGSASVKQSGENITAIVTRTRSLVGKSLARTFHCTGKVRGGQLIISFEEPGTNGFISGALILKVSGDVNSLSGHTVYFDHDSGAVVAHPIRFRRA